MMRKMLLVYCSKFYHCHLIVAYLHFPPQLCNLFHIPFVEEDCLQSTTHPPCHQHLLSKSDCQTTTSITVVTPESSISSLLSTLQTKTCVLFCSDCQDNSTHASVARDITEEHNKGEQKKKKKKRDVLSPRKMSLSLKNSNTKLCKNPTKDLEINVSEISSISFVLLLPDKALFSRKKERKQKRLTFLFISPTTASLGEKKPQNP